MSDKVSVGVGLTKLLYISCTVIVLEYGLKCVLSVCARVRISLRLWKLLGILSR